MEIKWMDAAVGEEDGLNARDHKVEFYSEEIQIRFRATTDMFCVASKINPYGSLASSVSSTRIPMRVLIRALKKRGFIK